MKSEKFLRLLSAFVNDKKLDAKTEYDWENIYYLASIHNVLGMLYVCIKNNELNVPTEILAKLQRDFLNTSAFAMKREAIVDNLSNILAKNNIENVFIKGYVVKDYYPVKEMRTMGDVDVLIREEDREKCHRVLVENGFEYDDFGSKKYVRNYVKKPILFEVHTKLISKNTVPNVNLKEYFVNPFNHLEETKENTKFLNKEYHFIYLISHMVKHFVYGGFGVSMILDIPAFINHYKDTIDWKYIASEIDGLGLSYFTQVIFKICNLYFDVVIPEEIGTVKLSDDDIEAICEYMINGGVFGYVGRNNDAIRVSKHIRNTNVFAATAYRFLDFMQWLFPSYEYMSDKYDWFRGKPKVFLPLGWIYCIWYRMFKHKENSFSRIRQALQSGDDVKKHSEIEKLMGIGIKKGM